MEANKKLLIIHSSARKTRSITRGLADAFLTVWKEKNSGQVVVRDIGMSPPPAITEDWIGAAFTKSDDLTSQQRELLELSNTLVDEVKAADVIVIGTPMYNYSIPASLKAWFDLIARVNLTFSFDLSRGDNPIEPILSGKKLVTLSSRGEFGFEKGGIREDLNGLDPVIRACAHYLGANASEITNVIAEYEEFQDSRWTISVEAATEEAKQVAKNLA